MKRIESNKERLIEASDKIWEFAEIGLLEEKSSKLLADILERDGFTVDRGVANMSTAFVANYGTGKPVIGIAGEFDALPGMSQEAGVPTKKPIEEGKPGHGCGHNLYGVACLGAVLAVKEKIEKGEVKGTIRFYGCPAEENSSGKVFMIKAGLFNDVDITLTWHPSGSSTVWSTNFQAIYSVLFRYHGTPAHAASSPWDGRSALDAVELMNIGVNYLREHVIPDSSIHYIITKGGEAPNIVPAEAEVWYYIRAPLLSQVKEIYERVIKIAKGAEMMTETELEMIFLSGSANMLPNYTLEDLLEEKMKEVGPIEYTK